MHNKLRAAEWIAVGRDLAPHCVVLEMPVAETVTRFWLPIRRAESNDGHIHGLSRSEC